MPKLTNVGNRTPNKHRFTFPCELVPDGGPGQLCWLPKFLLKIPSSLEKQASSWIKMAGVPIILHGAIRIIVC